MAAVAAPALQEEGQETLGSWADDTPLLLQNGWANMLSFKSGEVIHYVRGWTRRRSLILREYPITEQANHAIIIFKLSDIPRFGDDICFTPGDDKNAWFQILSARRRPTIADP